MINVSRGARQRSESTATRKQNADDHPGGVGAACRIDWCMHQMVKQVSQLDYGYMGWNFTKQTTIQRQWQNPNSSPDLLAPSDVSTRDILQALAYSAGTFLQVRIAPDFYDELPGPVARLPHRFRVQRGLHPRWREGDGDVRVW